MRLLAFSDLHLEAPFVRGGPRLAALRRASLRNALARIVELAHELRVDAVLCPGDLYEHERFTPDTVALLERSFAELAPIPLLVAPGNHDWWGASSIYAAAEFGPHVHVFDRPELTPFDGVDGLRIWGAAHRAPSGTAGFLDDFAVDGDAVHLGLFHGSELGGWAGEHEAGKVQHAPFHAHQIATSGLAHAVVGHHHRRVEGPHHTYPGCPVPLAYGDPGDGGAVLLELDGSGVAGRTWHSVTDLRAHDLDLDLTGLGDLGAIEQLIDTAVAPLDGVARVTLVGELAPSLVLDLDVLASRRGDLQELMVRTGRLTPGHDLASIGDEPTVRGQFVRDVLASDLSVDQQQRVILTGLRALEGRDDLEVA